MAVLRVASVRLLRQTDDGGGLAWFHQCSARRGLLMVERPGVVEVDLPGRRAASGEGAAQFARRVSRARALQRAGRPDGGYLGEDAGRLPRCARHRVRHPLTPPSRTRRRRLDPGHTRRARRARPAVAGPHGPRRAERAAPAGPRRAFDVGGPPGLKPDFNARVRQPDGFVLPAPRDEHRFETASGKARFAVNELQWVPVPEGRPVLQTMRSHDQYNTTICGLSDRYRCVDGGRRVLVINAALVPLDHVAIDSNTPASRAVRSDRQSNRSRHAPGSSIRHRRPSSSRLAQQVRPCAGISPVRACLEPNTVVHPSGSVAPSSATRCRGTPSSRRNERTDRV